VAVPSNAKIFVNGNATTSKGAVREFVSRGLSLGKAYTFKVRAELDAVDGQKLVESKEVVLKAGGSQNLQFAFSGQSKAIETALTLNVPEGAKVTLAGNATKAIGETRTYRTKSMTPGEVWDDYEVKVALGDKVKKQRIRLIAGDQLALTFDFNDGATNKLASR
ncbi:MAG: TIGR03000 domain-containing protein, partial [Planctomycetota bacterium]